MQGKWMFYNPAKRAIRHRHSSNFPMGQRQSEVQDLGSVWKSWFRTRKGEEDIEKSDLCNRLKRSTWGCPYSCRPCRRMIYPLCRMARYRAESNAPLSATEMDLWYSRSWNFPRLWGVRIISTVSKKGLFGSTDLDEGPRWLCVR